MAFDLKLGTNLQTGVTDPNIEGIHAQSSTITRLGEIKEYKDKDGKPLAVYVSDADRQEVSIEALIESSAPDYQKGDPATIAGIDGIIVDYKVIESNEDVKKVQMTVRTYPGLPHV